jgi:hypothetical protein
MALPLSSKDFIEPLNLGTLTNFSAKLPAAVCWKSCSTVEPTKSPILSKLKKLFLPASDLP